MVQGVINRGRHTDHPAGRHSIRTNQCPPPLSPHIFLQAKCPSCRPTNSVKALKATRIQCNVIRNSNAVQFPSFPHLWSIRGCLMSFTYVVACRSAVLLNILYYYDDLRVTRRTTYVDCLIKLVRSTRHTANSSHSQLVSCDELVMWWVDWQPIVHRPVRV